MISATHIHIPCFRNFNFYQRSSYKELPSATNFNCPTRNHYIVVLHLFYCLTISDVPQIVKLKLVPVRRDRYKKKIQCIVRGNPKPSIYWTFNGKKLETSKRIEFEKDNSILVIDDVSPKDTGHYRCHASNSYGMIFAQIHLNIKGKQHFTLLVFPNWSLIRDLVPIRDFFANLGP